MQGMMIYVPEEVASTPVDGEVLVDRWWSVHPEKGIAFYHVPKGYNKTDRPAPQCHRVEATARHLRDDLLAGHVVKKIPVVFLTHAAKEAAKHR